MRQVTMWTSAFAFLSVVGAAVAQGVSEQISPSAPPPPGCIGSFNGNFEVQVRNPIAKRDPPIQVSPYAHWFPSTKGSLNDTLSS